MEMNNKSKRKMKSIQMQLTTECNQRCTFCRKYTWDKREMPLYMLRMKIDKYKSDSTTFQFSGGEPLMYKYLKELNDMLESKNVKYKVYTNLSLPLYDEHIRFIDNAEEISVSVDALSKRLYNEIRNPVNKRDAFYNLFKNINKISYTGGRNKLKLCTVVNKLNVKEIPTMVIYAESRGIQHRFYPLHTNMDTAISSHDLEWLERELIRCNLMDSEFTNIQKIFEPGYFDTVREFKGCRVRNYHRVIDEQGREYTCCYAINDNGEDWNGCEKLKEFLLDSLDKGDVLAEDEEYSYCKKCSRYSRANECSLEEFESMRYL